MLSYFIFFPPHLCRLYTSNSGIFILMMQTKAERFFFYFGKCCFFVFFCVVSDGKKKKHMSTIGSSTGGLFFFAEIADGDTCSGWRDTDLKGPRWSFKVTVATYCSACVCVCVCMCVSNNLQMKQVCENTGAGQKSTNPGTHSAPPPPPPPPPAAAAASSHVVPSINQQQHYVWDGSVITVNRRDERWRWLTGRTRVWKLWEQGADNNKVWY